MEHLGVFHKGCVVNSATKLSTRSLCNIDIETNKRSGRCGYPQVCIALTKVNMGKSWAYVQGSLKAVLSFLAVPMNLP